MNQQPQNIVFFDGLCVLCEGTVAALIRIDRKRALRYSSLQGEYAKHVLSPNQLASLSSIVFLSQEKFYERASAVTEILIAVGGVYGFFGRVFALMPPFLSNAAYDLVARYRYRIFGRNETCMVPAPELRELFLP